jgi:hypothetical protein
MTFQRLRERVTKAGLLTNEEADQFFADMQSPDFHAFTGVHFPAWGTNRPDEALQMTPVWPRSVCNGSQVRASQSRIVVSIPAEAIRRPSGLMATQ